MFRNSFYYRTRLNTKHLTLSKQNNIYRERASLKWKKIDGFVKGSVLFSVIGLRGVCVGVTNIYYLRKVFQTLIFLTHSYAPVNFQNILMWKQNGCFLIVSSIKIREFEFNISYLKRKITVPCLINSEKANH